MKATDAYRGCRGWQGPSGGHAGRTALGHRMWGHRLTMEGAASCMNLTLGLACQMGAGACPGVPAHSPCAETQA